MRDKFLVFVVAALMLLSISTGLFIGVPEGDGPYLSRVLSRDHLILNGLLLVGAIVVVLGTHWLRSRGGKK